jgi:hypothetical protein
MPEQANELAHVPTAAFDAAAGSRTPAAAAAAVEGADHQMTDDAPVIQP